MKSPIQVLPLEWGPQSLRHAPAAGAARTPDSKQLEAGEQEEERRAEGLTKTQGRPGSATSAGTLPPTCPHRGCCRASTRPTARAAALRLFLSSRATRCQRTRTHPIGKLTRLTVLQKAVTGGPSTPVRDRVSPCPQRAYQTVASSHGLCSRARSHKCTFLFRPFLL